MLVTPNARADTTPPIPYVPAFAAHIPLARVPYMMIAEGVQGA